MRAARRARARPRPSRVSNAIWEKPGPFGLTDWERVQLHPYFTERSFAHSPALAPIGELAGAHHERLDGVGLPPQDACAGTRPRGPDPRRRRLLPGDARAAPHRPALDAAGAEAELLREAREGRLCPEAVDAVLAAAGHRVAKRPRELPEGLTDRELEVLLALVAGKTNKEIAETLGISAKTAGHHVQHIFDKAGRANPAPPRRSGRSSIPWCAPYRAFARRGPGIPGAHSQHHRCRAAMPTTQRSSEMILATSTVEDFDRFLSVFSTTSAEKRKQHGSKGATVFRDPNEDDRVWVLFDWDAEGWQSFVSDPEVPPIMQKAGHKSRPQAAELGGRYDA